MRLIPFLASLSGCIAELQTQCTSDDQYIVSLPYTIQNSTLLSATAGICSEKNITYAQDVATFNVTIDINRCKLNTKTYPKPKVQAKNLFMANITNLKVGRTGNGMTFTYLDMDIATECGRQMSYEISHEYGAIASAGSVTPDVGVNETDVILPGAKTPFTFSFQEYTNLFFNETRATGPRQAGTKSFVAITATNMDVTEYSFHVPSCKIITTTGKEQPLFRSVSEENSFIDLYKDYRTINGKQEFLLSHIFFVLDRNSTARYNLTCNVRVCAKDHLGENCDILQSCSTNPCVHGTCQDKMSWQTNAKKTDYTCTCDDNYKGTNCDQAHQLGCNADFNITDYKPDPYRLALLENGVSTHSYQGGNKIGLNNYWYKDIPAQLLSRSDAPVHLIQGIHQLAIGEVIEAEYTPKNTAGTAFAFVEKGHRDGDMANSLPLSGWQKLNETMKWWNADGTWEVTIFSKALDGSSGKVTLPASKGAHRMVGGMAIKPCV